MRIVLLAVLLALAIPGIAQARCAPGPNDHVLARTPAGTVAYLKGQSIFACRRGGRPVRLGAEPFFGDHELRLAGGFAALARTDCDRYYGGCFETRITVWNLRRGKRTATRRFSSSAGDDVYGDLVDMELCANGSLAALLRVGANLEFWSSRRSAWWRVEAEPGREGSLVREGGTVWATRDGARSTAGYGLCERS